VNRERRLPDTCQQITAMELPVIDAASDASASDSCAMALSASAL